MKADKLFEVDLTREWTDAELQALVDKAPAGAPLYVSKHENDGELLSVYAVWQTPCGFGSSGFVFPCVTLDDLLEHLAAETGVKEAA